MAAVGSLNVSLGLNSAQFQQGLKSAQAGLGRFSQHAAKAGAAIGAAMAGIPTAAAYAMKQTINSADEMGKTAQKVGLATDELSRLKYAAEQSGVSFQGLSTALVRLSKSMSDVGRGTGEAKPAFDALGLSVKNADGSMKSSSQVMGEIATKFAGMSDGANKTALAVAIFGRAGADLVPMLNQGASGIDALKQRAEELGIVINDNTYKAAEKFNDALADMYTAMSGGFLTTLEKIAPLMDRLAEAMLEAAVQGRGFAAIGDAVADALRTMALGASTTVKEFQGLVATLRWLDKSLPMFPKSMADIWGGAGEAAAQYSARLSEIKKRHADFAISLQSTKQLPGSSPILGTQFSGGAPKPDAPEIEKAVTRAGGAAKSAAAKMTDAEREISRSYQKLQSGAQSLYDQTRTPLEAYEAQMQKLSDMMRGGDPLNGGGTPLISPETYTRGVAQAQEKLNEALIAGSDYAQSLLSNLNSMFDSFLNGSFKAADALKNLAKDLAKMAMNKVFQQLLGGLMGGGPGGKSFLSGIIPGFANGTPYARGGLSVVGERGPELVNLPRGSQVIPNRDLKGRGSQEVSFAPVYQIDARGAQVGFAEQLKSILEAKDREMVRRLPQLLAGSQRRFA